MSLPHWGPRQGDDEQRDPDKPQDESKDAHPSTRGHTQSFDENRVADETHRCSAARQGPPHEYHQRGERSQGIQELWRSEVHVSLRYPSEYGLG